MKTFLRMIILLAMIALTVSLVSCGPSTRVSVGVGVHVPGAWGGPYPGGGVWVGTPVYPPYYYPAKPSDDKNREFVLNGVSGFDKASEAVIPYRLSE
jgi:hypothetical protein